MWLITFETSSWKRVCWIRWRSCLFEIEACGDKRISLFKIQSAQRSQWLWSELTTKPHFSISCHLEDSTWGTAYTNCKCHCTSLICRKLTHQENTSLLEQLISHLVSRSYVKRSFTFEWVWDCLIWECNMLWQRELHLTLKRHFINGEIHKLERIRRWLWWWWW